MSERAPLSVLHINTEPTWRGGEQQTLYLLEGLRERGVEGVLVARAGGVMAERAASLGHEVVSLPMRGEADISVPLRIARIVRDRAVDILHAHTSHGHVYAQLAAALSRGKRPQVVVHRRVDFSIFRRSFLRLNSLKYRYGVDRYIAVSHAIKQVLIGDGIAGDRVSVVHSGIDLERISDAPDRRTELRAELEVPEGHALVANVAHCADHKGQIYLIDAIPEILARHPQTVFAIIGDGELKSALEQRAAELGVAAQVRFPGFRKDVPQLLKALDIFVMPSHMEGLGTSVLDALAARRPVVGTEAGGMPEMLEDEVTGLVCPVRDAPALAEAIARLLSDPELARRVAEQGYDKVRAGFSRDAMVEGNLAVYEALRRPGDVA